MRLRNILPWLAGSLLAGGLTTATAAEDPPAKPEMSELIVIDAAGKEHKLKSWQITLGVRHLTWLAPEQPGKPSDPPEPGDKPEPAKPGAKPAPTPKAVGPLALEMRELDSTSYVKGVLTLVPLDRVQAIDYDDEKQTVTVTVKGAEADGGVTLTGSTRFRGINKLTLRADVDRGPMGVAEITFQGGVPKGIKGLRFASPKPAKAPAGNTATITVNDEKKAEVKVNNLQPLYQVPDGMERLAPFLMFRKSLKVELAQVEKLVNTSGDAVEATFQVVHKDGNDDTLTLLNSITLDGKPATLLGLLGEVDAGYRLFPVHTILEVNTK
jgi:hypothetical protein